MSTKANQFDTIATVGGIDTDDTSFTLTTGAFDTKTSGDKVALTIDYDNSAKLEVIVAYIDGTAVSSAVRAQDGTAAVTHSAGAKVCIGSVPSTFKYWLRNDSDLANIAISSAWTSFTPTWGNTGTANTLGNGTLAGAYIQVGKIVHYRVSLTWGSTTASGDGSWTFAMPVGAKAVYTSNNSAIGVLNILDTGTANHPGIISWYTGDLFTPIIGNAAGTYVAAASVTSAQPMNWAVGDTIYFSGSYEAV